MAMTNAELLGAIAPTAEYCEAKGGDCIAQTCRDSGCFFAGEDSLAEPLSSAFVEPEPLQSGPQIADGENISVPCGAVALQSVL